MPGQLNHFWSQINSKKVEVGSLFQYIFGEISGATSHFQNLRPIFTNPVTQSIKQVLVQRNIHELILVFNGIPVENVNSYFCLIQFYTVLLNMLCCGDLDQ